MLTHQQYPLLIEQKYLIKTTSTLIINAKQNCLMNIKIASLLSKVFILEEHNPKYMKSDRASSVRQSRDTKLTTISGLELTKKELKSGVNLTTGISFNSEFFTTKQHLKIQDSKKNKKDFVSNQHELFQETELLILQLDKKNEMLEKKVKEEKNESIIHDFSKANLRVSKILNVTTNYNNRSNILAQTSNKSSTSASEKVFHSLKTTQEGMYLRLEAAVLHFG